MLKPFFKRNVLEAGCDEAGRGCLAGPVFAAAVIFPKGFRHPDLNDSKQLTEAERLGLRQIIEKEALAYGVAFLDNHEIDKVNILKASFYAMHRAIEKLSLTPEFLLIDGNRFIPYGNIPFECVIKGDEKYQSIAAASILAKTYRDDFMKEQHELYPEYSWNTNKGYPTEFHRSAIVKFGITSLHRQSFQLYPLPEQQELFQD